MVITITTNGNVKKNILFSVNPQIFIQAKFVMLKTIENVQNNDK
jgi:hypothetical protein